MTYTPAMIHIDWEQVDRFAARLPELGTVQPFDFCSVEPGTLFPSAGTPGALEFFFANAAHQFGFWTQEGDRYDRPMIARVGGKDRKGSDYLFYCFQRALSRDADAFNPSRLVDMSDPALDALFHDDSGRNPLPMWTEHQRIFREYADWFVARSTTPAEIVREANAATKPLATFLELAGSIPGYCEDPLKKKLMLLAVMMEHRPEHFLHVTDPESAVPIIDYHLQRSALRTGLVQLDSSDLAAKIEQRQLVSDEEESTVRQATYDAVRELVDRSGLSVAAVDYFFFMNRTRCPEMSEPRCAECPVQDICRQRKELFQPVFRTEAY